MSYDDWWASCPVMRSGFAQVLQSVWIATQKPTDSLQSYLGSALSSGATFGVDFRARQRCASWMWLSVLIGPKFAFQKIQVNFCLAQYTILPNNRLVSQ